MSPRHARTTPRRPATTRRSGAPFLQRLLIVLLALAGSSTLLYPSAGNWFSDRAHASVTTGYTEVVASMPAGERAAELDRARAYNARLGQGSLTDPYSSSSSGQVDPAERADYLDQLSLTGSGTIAGIRVPSVGIALPVYHGTSEQTLTLGVGHLEGSALPVGGTGTNSVLTGHSGVPQARLFTDLHGVEAGDLVYLDVMGETFAYEIDRTDVVLPTETDLLQPVKGEDLVTLVTCTPVGVNSHRLVVQAHRVEVVDEVLGAATVAGRDGAGFPWWVVALAVVLALAGVFLFRPAAPGRERRSRRRPAPRHARGRHDGDEREGRRTSHGMSTTLRPGRLEARA